MAGRFLRFSLETSTWSAGKSFERGPQSGLIGAFRLAGLGNTWTDKATCEVHESCTMLTINADIHPLVNRMHKPDTKLGTPEQDKRSVISIEAGPAKRRAACHGRAHPCNRQPHRPAG